MTAISAVMRRSYTPTMFADLTTVAHARTFDSVTKVTSLTFAEDLDEATAEAIWTRMESASDVDMAKRAALRDAAALPDGDALRLTIDYLIGD